MMGKCLICGEEVPMGRACLNAQVHMGCEGKLAELARLQEKCERLRAWVNDLQAGMYINCVYCGHRYGPDTEVAASMADVLKEHIEQCPDHPLSAAKQRIAELEEALADPLKMLEALAKRYGWVAVQVRGIEGPEAQLEVAWDTEEFEYLGGPSYPMAGIDHTRAEAAELLGVSIKRPLTEQGIADVVAWSEEHPPKGAHP